MNKVGSKLKLKPGVVTGQDLIDLYAYCREAQCALPAYNVIGSSSLNAAMQAAKEAQAPVIIQFSNGGAHFNAGKFLDNTGERAAVAGAVAGAHHVHILSKIYGVAVVLHTDHAARKLLPWIDGLLEEGAKFHKENGTPLFSSHMLDLSEESLEENLATCKEYMKKLAALDMQLELELGVTGGEEDGVDNSNVDASRLYTQPEEVLAAYEALKDLGQFTVAASFGNTHGVYKPGNVKLKPEILKASQEKVSEVHNLPEKPLALVFHGGSGSSEGEITEAVSYGVVKFNIDTDTQWAFTQPIKKYMDANDGYLHSQVGNPEGPDKPNKKKIDPRGWMHLGEKQVVQRLVDAFGHLGATDKFVFGD